MEEYTYTPESKATSTSCVNCDHPFVEPGHPTPLCRECREALIKYPIPRNLWIFAGVITMVMIINLLKLPAYIQQAAHLIRAERAVEEHNYLTAQREAAFVLKEYPEHIAAHSYNLIASAYNFDMDSYALSSAFLENKTYIVENLVVQCNGATEYLRRLNCDDTLLLAQLDIVVTLPLRQQIQFFDSVAASQQTFANVAHCGAVIGEMMLDNEQLPESRQILEKALEANPDHYFATLYYSSVLRKMGELDKADSVCNILLDHNHQDAFAMSAKARVMLRKKKLEAAEELARDAIHLDSLSAHALASLALVLDAKGKKADSRELLLSVRELSADRGDTSIPVELRKVLDGEIVYR